MCEKPGVGWGGVGTEWVVCLNYDHVDVFHIGPLLASTYLSSYIWKLSYSQNKAQGNLYYYSFGHVLVVSI